MSTYIDYTYILDLIPQKAPFRFVDELIRVDENIVEGKYRFKKEEFFYKGHFPDFPITPSVILVESMAQIGMIPLGIFNFQLLNPDIDFKMLKPIFTTSDVRFSKPVYPNDEVTVIAEKIYFRMNKLKAKVKMRNEFGELVCSGELSGIFANPKGLKIG